MQFAILFIVAFLIGLAIYRYSFNWLITVSIPVLLFIVTTLLDTHARDAWAFTLIFGIPLVFFAALLGAYVVQIRQPEASEERTMAGRTVDEESAKE